VNVETERQVKAADEQKFAKQAEKQMLSGCQKVDSDCFLGQELSSGCGIMLQVAKIGLEIYWETLQNCVGPF
jgi:hypothetical protein